MQYNVAKLLQEPTGSTRSFSFKTTSGDAPELPEIAQGEVRLLRTHRGILAYADIEVAGNLVCSRCLGDFAQISSHHIEEEFLPEIDLQTGRTIELLSEDEPSFSISEDHTIDLNEALRQYIIGDEPMKPLCRANCLGLCHICGIDLNQGTCKCETYPVDPRWTTLTGLMNANSC